jgi:hypothetical protein
MTGRCEICHRDRWTDGKEREINTCSVCGKWMCVVCWSKHRHPGQEHYYTKREDASDYSR